MNRDELMRKIQETGFALYDLTLFLDTHPQNQMALDYFTDVQKNHTELQAEYEMMYGPLTAFDTNTAGHGSRIRGLGNWRFSICGIMKED